MVGRQVDGAARRIAELGAVVDAVREVSTANGVEEACRALVKAAARAVPRAEIVFVALASVETGDLAVAASTGLISPEFRFGRAPRGHGLWGRAAEQLLPVRTGDYAADRSFEHDDLLDDACRADGVVSAMCAPLVVGGVAIGAVFTNGRATDMFDEGDTTRLAEIAHATAPVIQRAESLARLEAAVSGIAATRNRLTRSVTAHDALLARILRGAGRAEVVDTIVDTCEGVVAALGVDAADRAVVTAPEDSELDPLRDRWILDGISDVRRTEGTALVEHREGFALFVPARAADRYVGAVVVVFERPVDDTDIRAVQRLVTLFALVAVRRLEPPDAPNGAIDGVQLRALVAGRGPVSDAARARLARRGFALDADRVVAVVAVPLRSDPEQFAGALRAGGPAHDAVLVVDHTVVILTERDGAKRVATEVAATVRSRTGVGTLVCAAAVSDPVGGGLGDAHRTAGAALELLQSLGRTSGAFDVDEFPAHLPLLRSVTVDSVVRFLDDTIGPVIEFDRHSTSELVRTMQVFFAANMNTAATARTLDLHPNTIIKRLRRVTEFLGPRWQGDPESLAIRIALNLHTLAVGTDDDDA